jgi:aminobenzoyl-glutamate utilization protein B
MVVAAKALALTAADLFSQPATIAAAKADFQKKMSGKTYATAIPPTKKPPLDYREK